MNKSNGISFLKNIFVIEDHNETHLRLRFFNIIKIKFLKQKYARKKQESSYYYYKKNNIDITSIPPATGQIRDIQLANLVLLRELDYVCKQNGLNYWLDGGTLLGAVRHKGFIPWDDDIDTAMLRKDYDLLIDAFNKSSRDRDIYADYFRSKYNSCNYFIKIRHKKCPHLFIDIFPWDNYGKRLTTQEQLKISAKIDKIRSMLERETNLSESNEHVKNKLMNVQNKEILVNSSDEKGDYVWGIDFHHHWKNWFTHYEVLHPLKTIIFEGFEFPCLNDPDAFLTRLYGKYMEYPKKISTGHSMLLDLSDEEKNIMKKLKSSVLLER